MINTIEKIYNWENNFVNYKVTYNDGKISFVPNNEANTDYQAIQEWAEIEGNNIIDNGAQTMLFGFASFAERPFSTVDDDNNVNIQVTGNTLSISIGSVGITADSIVEIPDPNRLTLGTGTVTITADANLTVTGNATSLSIGTVVVKADANTSVTGNALTLSAGSVTVTGTAVVSPTGSALTLNTGEPGVITWNDIVPGVNMTWTNIDPY